MRRALLPMLVLVACGPQAVTDAPDAGSTADGGTACRWPEFSQTECALVKAMALPATLPPARGNRFGDDDAAALLGYQLFFDLDSLSPAVIRCASCHVPEQAFTTHVAQPRGVRLSPRNALSLTNAARTFPHFWDGSADSLWSQALVAIERPEELGGDRLAVVRKVTAAYAPAWTALFGPVPDLSTLPASGKPGDPTWNALSPAEQALVNGLFANVGKALEAYVRKLARGPGAVDRFVGGDDAALTAPQRQGLALFVRSGCVGCHASANFSDQAFHRLDAPLPTDPTLFAAASADRGRSDGLLALQRSEFNALSSFYDGTLSSLDDALTVPGDGYFLTPSLRNVAATGPWGHAGVFPSLEAVVRFHLGGGGAACQELQAHALSDAEVASLLDFLGALEGDPAPPQWASWPGAYMH
jgi:cytochrome c peroxidase